MLQNNAAILITGEINNSLVQQLALKGFIVDVTPFIKTESIQTKKVQQEIENISERNASVVFTSSNAVNAVHDYVQHKNINWKVYCIGNATRSLIEKVFNSSTIIATADNATDLSKQIIANKPSIKKVYFFCGNKRRDELPGLLLKNNIAVHEIEVYTTTILNHKLLKDYDAVVFFSPSAVNGFFENNSLNDKTVLFAIGNTTAEKIRKYSSNKIVISNKPGKKEVVEKMISYFER